MSETIMNSIQQLGESMPGGFFVYRADGDEEILYVNEEILDIFGCHTMEEWKELTGFTFQGMVYPEDLERVQNSIMTQVSEGAKKFDYVEYRIVRKDGTIRWVDDHGRLVHTAEYGDVYYVLILDITELHISREEDRRKAEIIEGLSADYTSVYLLDLDNGSMRPYRLVSEYFREIARELYEGNEELADWRQILPAYADRYLLPEDAPLFKKETSTDRIRERLEKASSYSVNYRRKEEGESVAYTQMSIVRIEGEQPYHRVVMGYRDVTEHILQAQQEVADRLKMEMELQKEKHANEIKSSFLFNISHDIRTPMNAIKGFTDLALRHLEEPERLKDYLAKVDESTGHLIGLIDDLLEMSRLDYGKIEVREERCDIRESMDLVLDMFRAQAEEKQLILEEEVELPTQDVYIDDMRFRRIMGNLIGNAVKFTLPGGKVKVSAKQKQASGTGYVRYEFTVSDTGIGMSEEFMQRMYEAFEREESSTQSGYIGTGMGLAITKRLLDVMGGSISVKSKKGEGSTFTVGLPLKLADFAADKLPSVSSEQAVHKASGEHRILLVEDVEINRLLAESVLQDAEFLVESVADGSDAVEAIKGHPMWYYDLVLMDIQMPVMNGYEATRAIRAMGREDTDLIPIIALSANARDEDKRMSMESGMNSHVAKPFDIAHLINTVNEHIEAVKR